MTARDDYPLNPQLHSWVFRQWDQMCDEIDRLRTEHELDRKQSDADEQTMLGLQAENRRLRERIKARLL